MPYMNPSTVRSPKDRVKDVEVVFDKGPKEGSWSLARLKFDGLDAVGIRWNGEVSKPGVGTPSSRSNPTWFILPDELASEVLSAAQRLELSDQDAILRGYQEMAADTVGEAEAYEWIEAHVGECL